ncbi:MAG: HEAT repeat domain-containing protein, partial [Planctomycetota bacterium]
DPRALAPLAWWRNAGGQLSRLRVQGRRDRPVAVESIQQAMRASLFSIAARATNIDDFATALEAVAVPGKLALIEASYQIGDPRLSPALSALLDHRDPQVVADAATALGANGDSRALSALCRVAAGRRAAIEREAAARTLRRLTGHHAGPGQAWALWWRDHGDRVAELYERDAFIARLHDPHYAATAADLQRFPASELMPLVDGFLDQGPPYWPPRALALLRRDDPRRWRGPLLERYDHADADDLERIGLVILLHELRVPDLLAPLRERLAALDAIPAPEGARHPHGSLRAALRATIAALPDDTADSRQPAPPERDG